MTKNTLLPNLSLALALLGGAALPALATTYTVTNTNDDGSAGAKRLGVRRQAKRDAAFGNELRQGKAPSPLRSAGALQNLAELRGVALARGRRHQHPRAKLLD